MKIFNFSQKIIPFCNFFSAVHKNNTKSFFDERVNRLCFRPTVSLAYRYYSRIAVTGCFRKTLAEIRARMTGGSASN